MCVEDAASGAAGDGILGKLRVADIFRRHADDYFAHHSLSPEQASVLRDVRDCRTMDLGGRVETCDLCGHQVIVYNSCMNRHCPACQYASQVKWVQDRMERVLEVPHFHVVFTVPSELRPLFFTNPSVLYSALLQCSAEVLMTLGRQRLKGKIGVTTVLHTWTREMGLHPHAHCIVTGGALSTEDGTWVQTREDYLFPVAVMRSLFAKLISKRIRREAQKGNLDLASDKQGLRGVCQTLRKLYRRRWVVYCEKPFSGVSSLVSYLGRYTHRVAISDNRLVTVTDEAVTFRTRDDKTVTVTPVEFIRRFLLHVLPNGFRKIRHFGLYASTNVKRDLVRAREATVAAGIAREAPPDTQAPIDETAVSTDDEPDRLCPRCRLGHMRTEVFGRYQPPPATPPPPMDTS
jgi:hypothetical protein